METFFTIIVLIIFIRIFLKYIGDYKKQDDCEDGYNKDGTKNVAAEKRKWEEKLAGKSVTELKKIAITGIPMAKKLAAISLLKDMGESD